MKTISIQNTITAYTNYTWFLNIKMNFICTKVIKIALHYIGPLTPLHSSQTLFIIKHNLISYQPSI